MEEVTSLFDDDGATFSDCGDYRYLLWRTVSDDCTGTVLFVMLNPSTAGAYEDDPTVRRCVGFARRMRAGRLEVVNLNPTRTPNPDELTDPPVEVDSANGFVLSSALDRADTVVAGWGHRASPHDVRLFWQLAVRQDVGLVYCLGLTDGGQPRHPLYVPANRHLQPLHPPDL